MKLQGMRHWLSAAGALLMTLCPSAQATPQEERVKEARALNEQVIELYEQGKYQQAIPLAQRAVEMREQELGPEHPELAESLDNLALLYSATAAYARAEPLHQRALAIREKALGPEHPSVADSLNGLANLHYSTGAYAKAEALHQQALSIRQKALGPEHVKTAVSCNNLALLYSAMGAYARAEALNQRALAIFQKALDPEDSRISGSLGGLASLYSQIGAYAKAESLLLRVLSIREKTLGPDHPRTADSLNNLAGLYLATGAYDRAESMHRRALAIREKVLGPEHPRTAESVGNLAVLYSKTGAYAKAEPLHQRELAIFEKVLGPESPRAAGAVSNLANLYAERGIYAKAEALQQRALAIRKKALGPEHPRTGDSLLDLANLYHDAGDYAKAEPLHLQALAIYKKALGPEHPLTATALNDLADSYSASGADLEAESFYRQAQIIHARNSQRFLLTGSESRKRAYLQELAKNTHRNVSFSVSVRSRDSASLGLTAVLQYKGRVLDEISGSVARLRQSVKPDDRELFEQLADVASQFSTLTYQGLGNLSPAQYGLRLDELRQQQEALESDLAKRSEEFRRQLTPVTVTAVSRALPMGAILVEWFRYRPFDPKATGRGAQQGATRYVAYVLEAGGTPMVVDVGDAQVIETSVREFLEAVQDPTRSDVKDRARRLSDTIVGPLRAHLSGAERVLISPDGILNLVPMAALMDEDGQYLVQRFEVTYLTSGRDVLRMATVSGSQSGAVVFANPDYGKPTTLAAVADPLLEAQRSADLDRSGIAFRPLPNTATEAQAIKSLLQLDASSVLMRREATESNLKQLHGPRILHVASHGFFLSDQDLLTELGPGAEAAIRKGENPLLRAGIALAGANTRRSGTSEDGILTALEAAQLDLHGTELVVLSACESGVGQVQNGEGVYGLRRALFIAGAQTQIAALWRVADRATGTLMVNYYQRLLEGQGRSAALRAAQRKMLATPQRSHPYYWASFVPIGDWAPLRAKRK